MSRYDKLGSELRPAIRAQLREDARHSLQVVIAFWAGLALGLCIGALVAWALSQ